MDPITALGAASAVVGLVGFSLQLGQVLQGYIGSAYKADASIRKTKQSLSSTVSVLMLLQDILEKDEAAFKEDKKKMVFTIGGLTAIRNVADNYQIILWKMEILIGLAVGDEAARWEKKSDNELQKELDRLRKSGERAVPRLRVSSLTILGKIRWALWEGELKELKNGIVSTEQLLTLHLNIAQVAALQQLALQQPSAAKDQEIEQAKGYIAYRLRKAGHNPKALKELSSKRPADDDDQEKHVDGGPSSLQQSLPILERNFEGPSLIREDTPQSIYDILEDRHETIPVSPAKDQVKSSPTQKILSLSQEEGNGDLKPNKPRSFSWNPFSRLSNEQEHLFTLTKDGKLKFTVFIFSANDTSRVPYPSDIAALRNHQTDIMRNLFGKSSLLKNYARINKEERSRLIIIAKGTGGENVYEDRVDNMESDLENSLCNRLVVLRRYRKNSMQTVAHLLHRALAHLAQEAPAKRKWLAIMKDEVSDRDPYPMGRRVVISRAVERERERTPLHGFERRPSGPTAFLRRQGSLDTFDRKGVVERERERRPVWVERIRTRGVESERERSDESSLSDQEPRRAEVTREIRYTDGRQDDLRLVDELLAMWTVAPDAETETGDIETGDVEKGNVEKGDEEKGDA